MTVETANYISQLDPTYPAAGDPKSEGDNHLRLLKTVLKTQFSNFGINAISRLRQRSITSSASPLGCKPSSTRWTRAKASKSGATYTGSHDFTGATPTVPTQATGDADQGSKHCVCFCNGFQCRPARADGNGGKFVTTDGTNASWSNIYGTPTIISTNTNAVNGGFYIAHSKPDPHAACNPSSGDVVHVSNRSGVGTCVIDRNGSNIMGLAENMTLDVATAAFFLVYADATRLGAVLGNPRQSGRLYFTRRRQAAIPEFTSSGTFTPSAALLANGGQCYYELIGGGSGGAVAHSTFHASGGNAGAYKTGVITVTGAVVSHDWRGWRCGCWDVYKHCGKRGLAVFYWRVGNSGGWRRPTNTEHWQRRLWRKWRGWNRLFLTDTTYTLDARGGLESMAWPVVAALQSTAHYTCAAPMAVGMELIR